MFQGRGHKGQVSGRALSSLSTFLFFHLVTATVSEGKDSSPTFPPLFATWVFLQPFPNAKSTRTFLLLPKGSIPDSQPDTCLTHLRKAAGVQSTQSRHGEVATSNNNMGHPCLVIAMKKLQTCWGVSIGGEVCSPQPRYFQLHYRILKLLRFKRS